MKLVQRAIAAFLFWGMISTTGYSSDFENHFGDAFDEVDKVNSELVRSDADSLLKLYHNTYGVDKNILDDVFGYLSCVVSNLELPEQVYINCGLSLVETVGRCANGFSTPCLEGIVGTATQCVEPIQSIAAAIGICNGATAEEDEVEVIEEEVGEEEIIEEDVTEDEIEVVEEEVEVIEEA